jgi:hypothetical protein
MTGLDVGPGVALVALGVTHGLNPGMGWLFAVALGLQEGSRRAVWRSLPPLAAGHAAAIALAVVAAALMGSMIPMGVLKWVVAATLLGLGAYRLHRHRHPRFGGMRVGTRDLAVWSFLMATAHGAGLMALPLVLRAAEHPGMGHAHHMLLDGVGPMEVPGLWGTVLHSGGYLAATVLAAVVVYERLGIGALKRLWINVDLVWAGALIVTAVLTPLA